MSKRRLENEIDELGEELLSALPPNERVRLLLTASGEGKDEWIARSSKRVHSIRMRELTIGSSFD